MRSFMVLNAMHYTKQAMWQNEFGAGYLKRWSRTKTFLEEQLRNILAASQGVLRPVTYLMV